jgi:putative hydrolase of the HAD superfamily
MSDRLSRKYQCVFFDLDHTLWDYERNSEETLRELYTHYGLQEKGIHVFEHFLERFQQVNLALWDLYDRGKIESSYIREERFKQILKAFEIEEALLCNRLSADYLDRCPTKGHLMPHAMELLEFLSPKYKLCIVTNGFEEIQGRKLQSSKIDGYFEHVVTSHKAGCKKPDPRIFSFALRLNNAAADETIMIGDNLITDIGGARASSIDAAFFNPLKISHQVEVDYEIHSLIELQKIL